MSESVKRGGSAGLSTADLFRESAAELAGYPARSLLTVAGIGIGVMAIVVSLLLVTTARFQVSDQFDARLATQIDVRTGGEDPAIATEPAIFAAPWDAEGLARTRRLPGITSVTSIIESRREHATSPNNIDDLSAVTTSSRLFGVDPDAVRSLGGEVRGPGWTSWHAEQDELVVVVPDRASHELGLGAVAVGDQIFVDGIALTIVGTVSDIPRLPALESRLLVPETTLARSFLVDPATIRLVVVTEPAAAEGLSQVVAVALKPEAPGELVVSRPTADVSLRQAVNSDLRNLGLALGVVVAAIGSFAVANTMLASVMRRYSEFGLRRAVGATPRHIAMHVLLDAGLLGLTGGVLGAAGGVLLTLAVSASQAWQPVIDPLIPPLAVVGAALVGIAAGVFPARVAAQIEPTDALRR